MAAMIWPASATALLIHFLLMRMPLQTSAKSKLAPMEHPRVTGPKEGMPSGLTCFFDGGRGSSSTLSPAPLVSSLRCSAVFSLGRKMASRHSWSMGFHLSFLYTSAALRTSSITDTLGWLGCSSVSSLSGPQVPRTSPKPLSLCAGSWLATRTLSEICAWSKSRSKALLPCSTNFRMSMTVSSSRGLRVSTKPAMRSMACCAFSPSGCPDTSSKLSKPSGRSARLSATSLSNSASTRPL
mmetsp:Transcript_74140/g.204624  ORF Transcript_74140/g.204624 Transcript_74140/m.204624 type:complete len:239 (-) Transcript_74140:1589-2305(-)